MTREAAALREVEGCLCCLGYADGLGHRYGAAKAAPAAVRARLRRMARAGQIEADLAAGLIREWDKVAGPALRAGLDVMEKGGGADGVLRAVAEGVKPFAANAQAVLDRGVRMAYDAERAAITRAAGVDVVLNLTDQAAKDWLVRDQMYWVGSAWDRQLGGAIASTVREVAVEQGLSLGEAARALAERVGPLIEGSRTDSYWRVVASAASTRARSFGAVEAFVATGTVWSEWYNPEDEVTCGLCLDLSGRQFSVDAQVAARDAMMAAATPEEARAAAPWQSEDFAWGLATEEIEAQGLEVPPVHGNCRCSLDVWVEEGEVEAVPGPEADAETREAFGALRPGEADAKVRAITTNPDGLTVRLDSPLTVGEIDGARAAVRARDAVVGSVGKLPGGAAARTYTFYDLGRGTRATVIEGGKIEAFEALADASGALAEARRTGVVLSARAKA